MEIAVATLGNFHAKPFGHGNAAQANVRLTPLSRRKNDFNIIHILIHSMSEITKYYFSVFTVILITCIVFS
jgi:hypothetical protein